ncbi:MAG: hypothetical protein ACEPOW_01700 [Bacteroidales bacterium]
MSQNPKFKIRHGYCHILEDKIVISNLEEIRPEKQKFLEKKRFLLYNAIYLFFFPGLSYNIIYSGFFDENWKLFTISTVLLLLLTIRKIEYIRTWFPLKIEKSKIIKIKFKKNRFPLTSYFKIIYENKSGKIASKIIPINIKMSIQKSQIEKAMELMR